MVSMPSPAMPSVCHRLFIPPPRHASRARYAFARQHHCSAYRSFCLLPRLPRLRILPAARRLTLPRDTARRYLRRAHHRVPTAGISPPYHTRPLTTRATMVGAQRQISAWRRRLASHPPHLPPADNSNIVPLATIWLDGHGRRFAWRFIV